MCKVLLEALAGAGYQMTDYEALCLLPAVVEKAGHNQVSSELARVLLDALPWLSISSWGQYGWGVAARPHVLATRLRTLQSGCKPCSASAQQPHPPLQDRVRALHRDVLRLACSLHPPHKVGACEREQQLLHRRFCVQPLARLPQGT